MWLDYKGQRHFLPTGMPEEPLFHTLLFNPRHQADTLDVTRHREHVYWLYLLCHVAQVIQDGDIPGQGGRVAGDVDDTIRFHVSEGFQDHRGAAGSWRVDYHNVGTDALVVETRHDIGGIAYDEFCVLDAIIPGILLRVLDGRLHDFNAVDLTGLAG